MNLCLDLDIGNSRTKWRCGSKTGSLDNDQLPELENQVSRVRVSTVSKRKDALKEKILERYDVDPEFASSSRELAGVTNAYEDVTQLGVDRWLALVAAWSKVRDAVVIVDVGTATTTDFVGKSGLHAGGYIIPGIETMQMSLRSATLNVQVYSTDEIATDVQPAIDTENAVRRGIRLATCTWIRYCADLAVELLDSSPRFFLTGGNASNLAPLLDSRFVVDQDLVLDGLAIALP